MSDEEFIRVTILLDSSPEFDPVQRLNELNERGFVLDEALSSIGVLTGNVSTRKLAQLSSVQGVLAVEVERADYKLINDKGFTS